MLREAKREGRNGVHSRASDKHPPPAERARAALSALSLPGCRASREAPR